MSRNPTLCFRSQPCIFYPCFAGHACLLGVKLVLGESEVLKPMISHPGLTNKEHVPGFFLFFFFSKKKKELGLWYAVSFFKYPALIAFAKTDIILQLLIGQSKNNVICAISGLILDFNCYVLFFPSHL